MEIAQKLARIQAAVLFRQLAEAFERGDSSMLSIEGREIELPLDIDVELEYDQDNGKAELEIEMKWQRAGHEKKGTRTGKFELFKGVDQQWYFHLDAANGETILASEGYTSKQNALKGIESVKSNAHEDNIEYRSSRIGQPYFVLKAANGEIIGVSQMYKRQVGAQRGAASVIKNAPDAPVIEIE